MYTCFARMLGWLLACGVAFGSAPAYGATLFIVTEPWVRVAPNGRSAEAYMQLKSTDGATVVGVRSEIAPASRCGHRARPAKPWARFASRPA